MRRQLVRFIPLQVVDDDNCTVRLISVFSKFGPSDFGAIVAKDRGVGGTMFPRSDLPSVLSLEVDNVDLERFNHFPKHGFGMTGLTFCLVCHAGGSSGSNVVYTTWDLETSKSSFPPNGSTGEL